MIHQLCKLLLCCLPVFGLSNDNRVSFGRSINPLSVIVIDPGHGGKDWGASVDGVREKDIVLDIALQLGKQIKVCFPDIKVVYTRSADLFVPLYERARIANSQNANLFISIHVNSVVQNYVNGTETYVFGQNSTDAVEAVATKENAVVLLEEGYQATYPGLKSGVTSNPAFRAKSSGYMHKSLLFANEIQEEFKRSANRQDRKVRQAEFLVLRETKMPGVLIETGFITNNSERSYLKSADGQEELAVSLFRAFKAYREKIEIRHLYSIVQSVQDQSIRHEEIKKEPETQLAQTKEQSHHFAVQVMALKRLIDPSSNHFKGERQVYYIPSSDFNRYFVGKFIDLHEAIEERQRLRKKFKSAFIVAIENNQLISIKKALERP